MHGHVHGDVNGHVLGDVAAAPAVRTLIDVFAATVAAFPAAPALDDGTSTVSYGELQRAVTSFAENLVEAGVRRGDRVGVRLPSGTHDLYIAILAILSAGAAYVPVDADDPPERAELVFSEAAVRLVVDTEFWARSGTESGSESGPSRPTADQSRPAPEQPTPADDAWIIFTSGSTGTPKGVAVSHRSAAAFVDAEARMFLPNQPIVPGDRVLAGLSVAFDASCEEMWLAWRYGACLVPAPRSLVRSGIDLGPWLIRQRITIVSTVPTLAALWPPDCLDGVRLLIFGGEACPPELVDRLVEEGREVWNTYGPTEATVVACGALLREDEPVRIGLPLDGWELAVVDGQGQPVEVGAVGELIIGGVGLARYLDPQKDAEKFAPFPTLGWPRAYRSGDLVRYETDGLVFQGRADEQVKLGGRRIELGEVDAALQALPDVVAAAAAVKSTPAGNQILVGYVVISPEQEFVPSEALARLREQLPAALVPVLAVVDDLPTRTSGKVDRNALPWPLTGGAPAEANHNLTGTAAWLAERWSGVLGSQVLGADDDFFAHGGGSLSAARLISMLRERFTSVTVADIYQNPRLGDLADLLDVSAPAKEAVVRSMRPVPRATQLVQVLLTLALQTVTGLRWLTVLGLLNNLLNRYGRPSGYEWAPTVSWWWLLGALIVLVSPPGRMGLAVLGARALLWGVQPGEHPRGGSVHIRVWTAERLADAVGAANLAGAPWIAYYARALGAKVGRDVHLHSLPPITGMLTLGRGAAIEPEVDLSGYWIDGDVLRLGRVHVGVNATVGSRSTLAPGARVGRDAQVEAGSWVTGQVGDGEKWAGAPAAYEGLAKDDWPHQVPRRRRWVIAYALASAVFALLPVLALLPGLALVARLVHEADTLAAATRAVAIAVPAVALSWLVGYALLTLLIVRALGIGVRAGEFPVRSRIGWQVWATERLMDSARSLLFPIYSSLFTPIWLRALGAQIGRGVEASTVLLLPKMTQVNDGAFLADDTMIASYELGRGWLRIAPAKVGKRAFLGNSAMAAPGRSVPKNGLIAVLSVSPEKAKKGSSWLGSPPVQLRRSADEADRARTFAPSRRVRLARSLVELCRAIPLIVTFAVGAGVLLALQWLAVQRGYWLAALCGGLVLLAAGAVAGAITTAAKWLLVGRLRVVEHPLWSSFVWRNEVVDTFVEMVAAPWFARAATGTPVLNLWLRTLGARIGRGVWCETYWLPEADLVQLGDAVTVNRGCVLQTHLFHDRIMRMDTVELAAGATLGPHGVILPAAAIGPGATVGPASLVMRGELVPAGTRWIGNPISPWSEPLNEPADGVSDQGQPAELSHRLQQPEQSSQAAQPEQPIRPARSELGL
ncbi:Pls/PosA family non-ribosomal peptide synthetase [Jatrophihabitans sp. GAS493]|uniref:Pls/PosA family non-ribosomal peptide synthetase n=1 Tax=Jatrophihabitans sp. GAS493 TaxID=1907575 RepID=UPI000BB6DDBF